MPGHPLADAVGLWPMSSLGTKVFDLSGNGNTGTFSGNISWGVGNLGAVTKFTGTSTKIIIAHRSSLVYNQFTYSAWINHSGGHGDTDGGIWYDRHDVTGQNAICISNEDGIKLFFDIAGTDRGVEVAVGQVTQGILHHVAVTHDGTSQKVYLDGIYVGGMSFAGALGQSTDDKFIGIGYATEQRDFNGDISHSLLYNRALSTSEIALLYREPFCVFPETIMPEFGIAA